MLFYYRFYFCVRAACGMHVEALLLRTSRFIRVHTPQTGVVLRSCMHYVPGYPLESTEPTNIACTHYFV